MQKSLVRLSLPLLLLLGVLLAAALLLAARSSPAAEEVAGPMQIGYLKPAAGPYSTPLTIPYVAVAGTSIHGGPIVEA